MVCGSEIVAHYFPDLSAGQNAQFEQLWLLYQNWNAKINVVSRKDIDELYIRHVLHSLAIAKVLHFKAGTKILDVGTGGGFPGIPLAIMFPDTHFHLVDSIAKKIKVVQAVSNDLKLENVSSEQIRAEKVKGKYDFVVSRAVTRMKPFIRWVKDNIASGSRHHLKNGVLYLKGGDINKEMSEIHQHWQSFDLSRYFGEPFFETKKVVYTQLS